MSGREPGVGERSRMREIRSICVFCGARTGVRPEDADAARATGRLLAERGVTLVYGGGGIGLMGIVADGALEAGGRVIGVIPQKLIDLEQAHRGVADMRTVRTMAERKCMMMDLSDAFVTLPGGIGTFDELFEVLTAVQLGFHDGPCGVVNVAGYFDAMFAMLDEAVRCGFWRKEGLERLIVRAKPEEVLDAMGARGAGSARVEAAAARECM